MGSETELFSPEPDIPVTPVPDQTTQPWFTLNNNMEQPAGGSPPASGGSPRLNEEVPSTRVEEIEKEESSKAEEIPQMKAEELPKTEEIPKAEELQNGETKSTKFFSFFSSEPSTEIDPPKAETPPRGELKDPTPPPLKDPTPPPLKDPTPPPLRDLTPPPLKDPTPPPTEERRNSFVAVVSSHSPEKEEKSETEVLSKGPQLLPKDQESGDRFSETQSGARSTQCGTAQCGDVNKDAPHSPGCWAAQYPTPVSDTVMSLIAPGCCNAAINATPDPGASPNASPQQPGTAQTEPHSPGCYSAQSGQYTVRCCKDNSGDGQSGVHSPGCCNVQSGPYTATCCKSSSRDAQTHSPGCSNSGAMQGSVTSPGCCKGNSDDAQSGTHSEGCCNAGAIGLDIPGCCKDNPGDAQSGTHSPGCCKGDATPGDTQSEGRGNCIPTPSVPYVMTPEARSAANAGTEPNHGHSPGCCNASAFKGSVISPGCCKDNPGDAQSGTYSPGGRKYNASDAQSATHAKCDICNAGAIHGSVISPGCCKDNPDDAQSGTYSPGGRKYAGDAQSGPYSAGCCRTDPACCRTPRSDTAQSGAISPGCYNGLASALNTGIVPANETAPAGDNSATDTRTKAHVVHSASPAYAAVQRRPDHPTPSATVPTGSPARPVPSAPQGGLPGAAPKGSSSVHSANSFHTASAKGSPANNSPGSVHSAPAGSVHSAGGPQGGPVRPATSSPAAHPRGSPSVDHSVPVHSAPVRGSSADSARATAGQTNIHSSSSPALGGGTTGAPDIPAQSPAVSPGCSPKCCDAHTNTEARSAANAGTEPNHGHSPGCCNAGAFQGSVISPGCCKSNSGDAQTQTGTHSPGCCNAGAIGVDIPGCCKDNAGDAQSGTHSEGCCNAGAMQGSVISPGCCKENSGDAQSGAISPGCACCRNDTAQSGAISPGCACFQNNTAQSGCCHSTSDAAQNDAAQNNAAQNAAQNDGQALEEPRPVSPDGEDTSCLDFLKIHFTGFNYSFTNRSPSEPPPPGPGPSPGLGRSFSSPPGVRVQDLPKTHASPALSRNSFVTADEATSLEVLDMDDQAVLSGQPILTVAAREQTPDSPEAETFSFTKIFDKISLRSLLTPVTFSRGPAESTTPTEEIVVDKTPETPSPVPAGDVVLSPTTDGDTFERDSPSTPPHTQSSVMLPDCNIGGFRNKPRAVGGGEGWEAEEEEGGEPSHQERRQEVQGDSQQTFERTETEITGETEGGTKKRGLKYKLKKSFFFRSFKKMRDRYRSGDSVPSST